jgi:hypothetical protein
MADIMTWLGVGIGVSIPVAVAIGLSGLGIIIELRKQGDKFAKTKEELVKLHDVMDIAGTGQAHEKIAVLYDYLAQIPWSNTEIASHKAKRIAYDIRAMSQNKRILTNQQREELRKIRDILAEKMASNNYDASEVKVVFEELFSS